MYTASVPALLSSTVVSTGATSASTWSNSVFDTVILPIVIITFFSLALSFLLPKTGLRNTPGIPGGGRTTNYLSYNNIKNGGHSSKNKISNVLFRWRNNTKSLSNTQEGDSDGAITLSSVAGNSEAKNELLDIIDFLKNPSKYTDKYGAVLPKGVLLSGPPGVGKTLLARAVANEAGVPFFAASGSSFMEVYVGVGPQRIRSLFEAARRASPSIIFIDEFDSIASARGSGNNSEEVRSVNELLTQMDGFSRNDSVVVFAATNFPESLDPAAIRPGRFERKINLHLPDRNAREDILRVHAKNKPMSTAIDFGQIASQTIGMSGAHLASVLNEAAILSAKCDHDEITADNVHEAIQRVMVGVKRENPDISMETMNRIAVHESGHALLSYLCNRSIQYVTIEPRSMALGYVYSVDDESSLLIRTKEDLINDIRIMLAGRIAEELFIGSISTGAQNDLERVYKLVNDMHTKYGMGEQLFVSEADDELINGFVRQHYEVVTEMLKSNHDKIDELKAALIDSLYLKKEEVYKILGR